MACEIKNDTLRPNGPFGDVVHRGVCVTHGFRVYGEALQGDLCPIGQIEAATEAALARINGGEVADTTAADPAPNTHGTLKRTRKPKAEPDA